MHIKIAHLDISPPLASEDSESFFERLAIS